MKHLGSILILMSVWTLLVAPSTCGGGLLAHACADDTGPDCHHESDCQSDPCNVANDVTTVAKTVVAAEPAAALPPTGAQLCETSASLSNLPDFCLVARYVPEGALPLLC